MPSLFKFHLCCQTCTIFHGKVVFCCICMHFLYLFIWATLWLILHIGCSMWCWKKRENMRAQYTWNADISNKSDFINLVMCLLRFLDDLKRELAGSRRAPCCTRLIFQIKSWSWSKSLAPEPTWDMWLPGSDQPSSSCGSHLDGEWTRRLKISVSPFLYNFQEK